MKSGIEYMVFLSDWYQKIVQTVLVFSNWRNSRRFPNMCGAYVVPRYGNARCTFWSYFCQISDSTTSYGSYSGAVPNEKITWGKLDIKTPKFIIESDATIVAPLIFAYLLDL
jgi:deoxyhypusine synthase